MNLSRPRGWCRSSCALYSIGLLTIVGSLTLLTVRHARKTGAASFTGIITDQAGAAYLA